MIWVEKPRVPFVLAATREGPMIVSRLDYTPNQKGGWGVGSEYLTTGEYDRIDVDFLLQVLTARHELYGDGLVVIDGGANIGAYTVPLAKHIEQWDGAVIAYEPQERVYYALCGNIALNNLFNVQAMQSALAANGQWVAVPQLDFRMPANYGMITLNPALDAYEKHLGQAIDRDNTLSVPVTIIDKLNLERLDLLKLDIEGMELDALAGAKETIERCRPVIMVEKIMISEARFAEFLGPEWREVWTSAMMTVFMHKDERIGYADWVVDSAKATAKAVAELLAMNAKLDAA